MTVKTCTSILCSRVSVCVDSKHSRQNTWGPKQSWHLNLTSAVSQWLKISCWWLTCHRSLSRKVSQNDSQAKLGLMRAFGRGTALTCSDCTSSLLLPSANSSWTKASKSWMLWVGTLYSGCYCKMARSSGDNTILLVLTCSASRPVDEQV